MKKIEPGSVWRHKVSGNLYSVVMLANEDTIRPDEYPVMVVYKNMEDQRIWARPLSRWHPSFEFVSNFF